LSILIPRERNHLQVLKFLENLKINKINSFIVVIWKLYIVGPNNKIIVLQV
jgi:hypothetical protein